MSRRRTAAGNYSELRRLLDCESGDPTLIPVVVETPKDRRNKYAYSEELGGFLLKAVLPAGMSFPYDFGFVPFTRADDGDPADVLLLLDEPAFTGCLVAARLVGVLEGNQKDGGRSVRNDRLVAVAVESHTHRSVRRVKDLDRRLRAEIAKFFVDYHKQRGKLFEVRGWHGPRRAIRLLEDSRRKFSPAHGIPLPALCTVSRG